ncbi:hypothetical protein L218DRAFT_959183 [Marasmius fiardii PR-910]|nr:hypothetical protein L218DRAFT_959183 [Marasmius fiardii PR-910]
MEANGIQRTPLVNRTATFPPPFQRTAGGSSSNGSGDGQNWGQANGTVTVQHPQRHPQQRGWPRGNGNFQQLKRSALATDVGRSGYTSDRSDSANEVENLLVGGYSYGNRVSASAGWQQAPSVQHPRQSVVAQPKRIFPVNPAKRTSGTFRPARFAGS